MTSTLELSDDTNEPVRANWMMALLAAFAVGQAVQINEGNLHPLGLAWLIVALVALVLAIRRSHKMVFRRPRFATALLAGLIAVQWIGLLIWGLNWRRTSDAPIGFFIAAMLVAGIGAAMLFAARRMRIAGMILLLMGHLAAGAYVIRAIHPPRIDLWYFQQESTAALLHGQNPYEVKYRNVYEPDVSFYGPGISENGWLTMSYPYPPLSLLMNIPARLAGDVRWGELLALELSAVLLALASSNRVGALSAAMLLLSPRSLLVVYAGWIEPLTILLLAATLFCAQRRKQLLWIPLGLLLASKQYFVLAIPLVVLLASATAVRRESIRLLSKAIALATAITLPFLLWNPPAFLRSVILWHLRQPFRIEALSFSAMIARLWGIQLPAGLGFLLAAVAVIFALRRAPRSAGGFATALSLVLLIFFAFNKQAACNYYFAVLGACCCGAAAFATETSAKVLSISPDFDSKISTRKAA